MISAMKPFFLCGVNRNNIAPHRRCWELHYGGNRQVGSILDWLYKDSTPEIRLDRKYDLYLRFKEDTGKQAESKDRALFDKAFAGVC
nr:hypothetical protein [Clostridia bacterium]